MFIRLLRAEFLKSRNTSLLTVTVLAPFIAVCIILLTHLTREIVPVLDWPAYFKQVLQMWFMLLLPLYIGVQTVQYVTIEHRANIWKLLFTVPTAKYRIVCAKVLVALLLVGLSFIMLEIEAYLGAVIIQISGTSTGILASAAAEFGWTQQLLLVGFGASIGIVVIQMGIALLSRNAALPLMIAVAGCIAAAMAQGRELLLHLLPWAWPSQAYLQIIGNRSEDALIPITYAIWASIAVGVASCLLLVLHITRRDEV